MKREEQIEVATAAYINGRLKNNVPPEEIEEIRLAYQAGAIYADAHPNDEVLKLRKMFESDPDAYKQGYKDAIDKACEYLKTKYVEMWLRYIRGYEIEYDIELFKKYMEEQQ